MIYREILGILDFWSHAGVLDWVKLALLFIFLCAASIIGIAKFRLVIHAPMRTQSIKGAVADGTHDDTDSLMNIRR